MPADDACVAFESAGYAARSFSVGALVALMGAVYYFAIRPGQLRWGATADELALTLPGDDLILDPTFCATRAVTISGRPEDIWPWIVQIGYGRAGFYGYDLIENLDSERGIRSAGQIVPELQHLKVGDRVYMSKIAYLVVQSMAPDRFLVWAGDEHPPNGAFTWALLQTDVNHTRLINRFRFRHHHWTDGRIVLDLFTEFADHVAVPKMLFGIRDRVEGRGIEPIAVQAVDLLIWLTAFLETAAAFILVFIARRWWRMLAVALVSGFVLMFVLYGREPAWIGALMDLAILAALVPLWLNDRPAHGLFARRGCPA
jgi:hypothetical protein